MKTDKSLLIEFFVEEIPAAQLLKMRDSFISSIITSLKDYLLSDDDYKSFISYKRFGILIRNIDPNRDIIKRIKGPAISAVQSDDNPALLGFCKKYDITDLTQLEKGDDGYFYASVNTNSRSFNDKLTEDLLVALKKMTNTFMTWQEYQFIRPIRNLVVMLNEEVLPITIFGCQSNNSTLLGKYIDSNNMVDYQSVVISKADNYFEIMNQYHIYPSFEHRRSKIQAALDGYCNQHNLAIASSVPESLLDEVTGLIESPLVLAGEFERQFLKVPAGVLILTMAKNQKYFALSLKDKKESLDNRFLLVADMSYPLLNIARQKSGEHELTDVQRRAIENKIINDNQQVLTARLVDAKFFYEQDFRIANEWFDNKYPKIQSSLNLMLDKLEESGAIFEYYNEKLKQQIYNAKLVGCASQWDRLQRIKKFAQTIVISTMSLLQNERLANSLIQNFQNFMQQLKIAAELSKFDLTTNMVAEFPELQGYIGAQYYLEFLVKLFSEFPDEIKNIRDLPTKYKWYVNGAIYSAINDQYELTSHWQNDTNNIVSLFLVLINNLEHIFSMWLVGNIPTSEKDPYGVRRAAKNVVGVLTCNLSTNDEAAIRLLELNKIWSWLRSDAIAMYKIDQDKYSSLIQQINQFILQRYKMDFKGQESADIANYVNNKIEQYHCKNLYFGVHSAIQQELYKLLNNKDLGYRQLLKRLNSLLNSKPDFLKSCMEIITQFDTQWYENCIDLHELKLEIYKLQEKDRVFASNYDLNSVRQHSVIELAKTVLNISGEQFSEEYFNLVKELIPLVNQFLDDVMVFDETDNNSQFHQTLLRIVYTMIALFLQD